MKKLTAMILGACLTVGISATASAHMIDDKNIGISFSLSDNWIRNYNSEFLSFFHKTTNQEGVAIETVDADWAWSMELVSEEELTDLCAEVYSDSALSERLTSQNNVYVRVKTHSVLTSYEYYNNIKYFRYEKAYTASATGFMDTPFYETVYVTVKNGKVYLISYQRDTNQNHFMDVADMLSSISFDNGEIKIEINGQRIYPDSSPMILEERTLVPIRAVAEKMGYTVGWDGENQLVSLTSLSDSTILHFGIGSDIALKNFSEEIKLDVPAIILEERTYLPLRAVAEAMDAHVNWNGTERTVEITR